MHDLVLRFNAITQPAEAGMTRLVHKNAKLRKGLRATRLDAARLGTSLGIVGKIPITRLGRGLATVSRGLVVAAGAARVFVGVLGSIAKVLGTIIGFAGPLALVFGLVAAARAGEQFNQSMTRSIAIMSDVDDAMRTKLTRAAVEVARVTQFSAAQTGEAFFFLTSAGLTAEASLAALPLVAKFAQSGNFDLARATSLLTDALSALGLKSKDAAENLQNMTLLSDTLIKANTLADATVEEFAEALSGPLAGSLRAMNRELNEGVALLALLAERGQKGSQASTDAMILFRDLPRAVAKAPEAFKKFGIELETVTGNLVDVPEAVKQLTDSLRALADIPRAEAMDQLKLQKRLFVVVQKLMDGTEELHNFQDALNDVWDTTDKVSGQSLTQFQKAWADIAGAIEGASLEANEFGGGPLVDSMHLLATLVDNVTIGLEKWEPLLVGSADKFITGLIKPLADLEQSLGVDGLYSMMFKKMKKDLRRQREDLADIQISQDFAFRLERKKREAAVPEAATELPPPLPPPVREFAAMAETDKALEASTESLHAAWALTDAGGDLSTSALMLAESAKALQEESPSALRKGSGGAMAAILAAQRAAPPGPLTKEEEEAVVAAGGLRGFGDPTARGPQPELPIFGRDALPPRFGPPLPDIPKPQDFGVDPFPLAPITHLPPTPHVDQLLDIAQRIAGTAGQEFEGGQPSSDVSDLLSSRASRIERQAAEDPNTKRAADALDRIVIQQDRMLAAQEEQEQRVVVDVGGL